MRVFVCYASERRGLAEQIALALRERRHRVFFDRTSLIAGGGYDSRIEREVKASDLFVFLISPESVQAGSYCLTELRYAEAKWPHPGGNVLPVMVERVPITGIPPYLRAVTLLEPRGSIPAEVAAESDRLRGTNWRRWWPAVAGIVVLAAAAAAFLHFRPQFEVSAGPPRLAVVTLLQRPDEYRIPFAIRNLSRAAAAIDDARIEVSPPIAIAQQAEGVAGPLNAAQERAGTIDVFATERLDERTSWRVCVIAASTQTCSSWQPWQSARSDPLVAMSAVLADDAKSVVQVVAYENGFAAIRNQPSELIWLDRQGQAIARIPLEGEPTVAAVAPGRVVVGTRGPATMAEFSSEDRSLLRSVPIAIGQSDPDAAPISTDPDSMVVQQNRIWILTRGTAGRPGLAYLDSHGWTLPPYYESIEFDLRDLALRLVGGEVWGAEDATTPASLLRLDDKKMVEFSGHDNDAVSCTRDVAGWRSSVLVWTCDQTLTALRVTGSTLAFASNLGKGPSLADGSGDWLTQNLAPFADGVLVGVNRARPMEDDRFTETVVAVVRPGQPTEVLARLTDARVVSLAIAGVDAMLLFEDRSGKRDLRHIRLAQTDAASGN